MLVTLENQPVAGARPKWLKVRAPGGPNYHELKALVEGERLHTVCESAHCPNIGECWEQRTATFMILGNFCTRRCGFCAVPKGAPTSKWIGTSPAGWPKRWLAWGWSTL